MGASLFTWLLTVNKLNKLNKLNELNELNELNKLTRVISWEKLQRHWKNRAAGSRCHR